MTLLCPVCHIAFDPTLLRSARRCPTLGCHGELAQIDEQILPYIQFFWRRGLDTAFSCAGHVHIDDAPEFIRYELPYVMFRFPTEDAAAGFCRRYASDWGDLFLPSNDRGGNEAVAPYITKKPHLEPRHIGHFYAVTTTTFPRASTVEAERFTARFYAFLQEICRDLAVPPGIQEKDRPCAATPSPC